MDTQASLCNIREEEKIRKQWKDFGFVVIGDVLDPIEVKESVTEIWDIISGKAEGIDRNKPETWYNQEWPDKTGKGFIQPHSEFLLHSCWKNRQNPSIVKAFQIILETEEIVVSRDRFNFMRPSLSPFSPFSERKKITDSTEHWLHWDQNGWQNSSFQGVQGVLTLSPQTISSGGFHCVPSFVSRFKTWFEEHKQNDHPNGYEGLVEVPSSDPMRRNIQKICCPPGSLIIWDSRTPHGNYPNESEEEYRAVQYITFKPYETKEMEIYRDNLHKEARNAYRLFDDEEWDAKIPTKEFQLPNWLSPLGKKVTGFSPWESVE